MSVVLAPEITGGLPDVRLIEVNSTIKHRRSTVSATLTTGITQLLRAQHSLEVDLLGFRTIRAAVVTAAVAWRDR